MADCRECGASVALDENFCGNCGAPNPPASAELKTVSATVEQVNAVIRKYLHLDHLVQMYAGDFAKARSAMQ